MLLYAFCKSLKISTQARPIKNIMLSIHHDWDAKSYSDRCHFVAHHGERILSSLMVKPGDRILDLGCGTGELSLKLIGKGATVVGIDESPAMVSVAKEHGIDARVMNGMALEFDTEFDAVFSNAAMHWMTDPDAVLKGVARALKPRGQFVAEMGGHGNVAAIHGVMRACLHARGCKIPEPWYFPTRESYAEKLVSHRFQIDSIDLVPRPTPIHTLLDEWLKILAKPFLLNVPDNERTDFLEDVTQSLAPVLQTQNGDWILDYVRLRFRAHLA